MKPLYPIVVAILVIAANAHPDNIEAVKELPQTSEPILEAEESQPQARKERCTACSGQNGLLAALKNLPKSEVHTQQSFEGCSSAKGCAGIKVKDGKVVQKFGNLEAFKAAASADTAKEFQFHEAGSSFFDGLANGPFWWMNENSPFKNGGATFEKFSKQTSSSFTSSGGADIAGNPFLNGDFSKLGGFSSAGTSGFSGSSAFESGAKEVDISKNPFLNGGFNGQSAFGSGSTQSGYNSFSSSNKFASNGYTGSSPTPFTASTGSNVNLIQNSQKNEYDYEQQQQTQQSIDDLFQGSGNVQGLDNAGGDLQQTCSGQGYVCVNKAQCNNGVVNANGATLLQANTQKQYCNVRSEICCRIETSSLAGAGSLQGSLGVGSATYNNQGSGLFSSNQNTNSFGFGTSQTSGSAFVNKGFGATSTGVPNYGKGSGTTLAPGRFGSTQSNFIDTDSFSAGSDNIGVSRPGLTGLKPGIPYLPPLDTVPGGSNVVSTAYPSTFVTTPRPFSTPRPVTTPRPFSTARPGYLPPVQSTKAPEYLPPIDTITAAESRPEHTEGQLILDQTLPARPPKFSPPRPTPNDIPAGCAAALKCTPIEFCTAEGVMTNTSVILTREQEAYRVPLTDCKDLETGRVGKCCRDPLYTDPWPTNQLGQWVPGVFGGNDGRYVPDSRVSSNNPRPQVTLRPDTTGSVIRNNFLTTQPPTQPFRPNQGTSGFPSTTPGPYTQQTQFGKGSYEQGGKGVVGIGGRGQVPIGGQGQYPIGGQGQFPIGGQGQFPIGGQGQVPIGGQGQFGQGAQGQVAQGSQFSQTTSQFGQGQFGSKGQAVSQGVGSYGKGQIGVIGQGQGVTQGQGQYTSQGQGQVVTQGQGTLVSQGSGTRVSQGTGTLTSQGQGFGISGGQGIGISQGGGQVVRQNGGQVVTGGGGQVVSQGAGFGVSRGQGQTVSQGAGFGVINGQGSVSQGQGVGVSRGQGQGVIQGFGQSVSQGQGSAVSQGSGFGVSQGQGVGVTEGQGFGVTQGQGFGVTQGQGVGVTQGQGFGVTQGQGIGVTQGQGFGVNRGQGAIVSQGSGFGVSSGQGQTVSPGAGYGVSTGQGQAVSQGSGFGVTSGQGTAINQGSGFGISRGQGQTVSQGQGQILSQGQGFGVTTGQGQAVSQGQGFGVSTGQGQGVSQGQGFGVSTSQGQGVSQGQGFRVSTGQGLGISQGQGFGVSTGQGQSVSQGQGFGVSTGQGQGVSQGQGFGAGQGLGVSQGQGFGVSTGQGQTVSQGQGFGVSTGQGQSVSQGFGIGVTRGQGAIVSSGQGQRVSGGQGQVVSEGQGFGVNQGFGYGVIQGQGQGVIRGSGQTLIQGQGQKLTQGFGTGVRTGGGYTVTQGGIGVENDYGESVQRVFLQRYSGSGECGILNPQKPYGNHKELEVDFAEIPWQAMVLLQTNRSLLCGGVITRPDVVVTSASCVEGLDAKNVLIKGGEWKLGIDDEPLPFQIVQVKHILRHPLFKAGSYKYDAAILVLTENLRLAKNIWPICLPSASDTLDAFYNGAGECILTGWGKQVLQAHLQGSIMHSVNVSLINPGQCEAKISQDYPHLLEQYDQDSCVCGQPTNPLNNICRVDIGSALACTTGDSHYVLRGVYSWDSGCQAGNQLTAFYKFDLEWYEWAIGLTESVRFAQFTKITTGKVSKVKTTTYTGGVKSSVNSGVKGFATKGFGVQGQGQTGQITSTGVKGFGIEGQGQTGQFDLKGFKGSNEFGLKTQGQSGQFTGVKGFGVNSQGSQSGQFDLKGFKGSNEFGLKTQGQSGQFAGITSVKDFTNSFGVEGQGQSGQFDLKGFKGTSQFGLQGQGQSGQFSQFGSSQSGEVLGPISKTFSATFTEKKIFQSEPKIVTYTTKPKIVTFTTKPEYFTYTTKPEIVTFTTKPEIVTYTTKPEIVTYTTKPEIVTYTTKPEIIRYTTKPKIVTYTTKPQIIRYETAGTKTNPQYVSFKPSFTEVVGAKHTHDAKCKCLENSKK